MPDGQSVTMDTVMSMKVFKRIISRALHMCDTAYIVFKYSVVLSCALLAGSLLTLIAAGAPVIQDFNLYNTAVELLRLPSGVLLIGIIASVCIEDMKA